VRLTVYTDFSLRVLIFLALKADGLATIAEIAEAYRISKNHLMKVVHQLGVAGYVETVRGKGGGLRLARPAEEIVVGQVVRRTEPDMALVPCFDPATNSCAILPGCALRGILSEAKVAFLSVLDRHTLADLVRSRAPLQRSLSLAADRRRGSRASRRDVRVRHA
jgi:Rrf2 family transcriptional regulator, nitric oxide-sensitive transcriptional repressor